MVQQGKKPMLATIAGEDPVLPALVGMGLKAAAWVLGLLVLGGLPGADGVLDGDAQPPEMGAMIVVLGIVSILGTVLLAWAGLIALAKLHAIYQMLRDQEHRHAAERAGIVPPRHG